MGREARDIWRSTRGAAAAIAIRLQEPIAATPQRSRVPTKEKTEGSAEGRTALHSHRADSRCAHRWATLPAIPRVQRAVVPSGNVRHETPGQQSVYHVVPGELEIQQFYVQGQSKIVPVFKVHPHVLNGGDIRNENYKLSL